MKLTKLHLIIILALALILCPILGVCYNAREGFEQLKEGVDINNENKVKKLKENMPQGEESWEEWNGDNFTSSKRENMSDDSYERGDPNSLGYGYDD